MNFNPHQSHFLQIGSIMTIIKLKGSDGVEFPIEHQIIAGQSILINNVLNKVGGAEDDDGVKTIQLSKLNSVILGKVLEWAMYHKDDDPPGSLLVPNNGEISRWDEEFLKVDQSTFMDLMSAAAYLKMQSLLDITCKTFADMIKGKTVEEIRAKYNIKNDFSPEEEEEIRKENEFLVELM